MRIPSWKCHSRHELNCGGCRKRTHGIKNNYSFLPGNISRCPRPASPCADRHILRATTTTTKPAMMMGAEAEKKGRRRKTPAALGKGEGGAPTAQKTKSKSAGRYTTGGRRGESARHTASHTLLCVYSIFAGGGTGGAGVAAGGFFFFSCARQLGVVSK